MNVYETKSMPQGISSSILHRLQVPANIGLVVLADPGDEEHANMLDWIGDDFDPEAVNAELGKL